MNLQPAKLKHGERYGRLTVLYKRPSDRKYKCGCACGWRIYVSARKLMRGEVKSCERCKA